MFEVFHVVAWDEPCAHDSLPLGAVTVIYEDPGVGDAASQLATSLP